MDRRITFRRKVMAQDPTYGAATLTPQTLVTLWAEVVDVRPSRVESAEEQRSGLVQARNQTRVRIRHRTDVDSTMEIVDGDRILQIIRGPAEIGGRKAYLEMMCETFTTPGA